MNPDQRPILVTGTHRSGTTWAGKMLAASQHTAYVSEPLNVLHRRGVFAAPVQYWYTYVCAENEADYLPAMHKTLALRYGLAAEIPTLRSWHDFLRMGRDLGIFWRGRMSAARPLLKDPFAIFSLEWFVRRLNCRSVVLLRHPGAFVSSLKRLGWTFDFNDLLAQPLLMRDFLEPYRPAMEAMTRTPDDVVGQASLLWCMIYASVAKMQENPHLSEALRVIKHEDLSLEPVNGFRSLYEWLDLPFTTQVERTILSSSSSENPSELARKQVHSVRLDSRANLMNWKKRLSEEEMRRVRDLTGEAASQSYPSWE